MSLLIEKPVVSYDLSQIRPGYLVYARHCTWDSGKAGFVTAATKTQMVVQYHPGIGNVTNHFRIPVSEVSEGKWEIRWSDDMSEVWEYIIDPDVGQNEEEKGENENES